MYKQTYKAGIPRSDASQNPCCSISRHTKLFSPQKPHYSKDFLYCINRVKKKYRAQFMSHNPTFDVIKFGRLGSFVNNVLLLLLFCSGFCYELSG